MIKNILLITIAFMAMATVSSKPTYLELDTYTFEQYVVDFDKVHKNIDHPEYYYRKMIFMNRLRMIKEHNSDETKSWKMGVNKFVDMTEEEMKKFKGRSKQRAANYPPKRFLDESDYKVKVADLPESFDWKTHDGILTPVKDQAQCGSCWAFSTVEVIESAAAINDGKLAHLSPQQLVDCSPNPNECGGTGGCEGSTEELAMDYLAGMDGLTTEANYRYTANDGDCAFDPQKTPAAVSITGYSNVQSNDPVSFQTAIVNLGPLTVSVAADFMFYDSGIFDGCDYDGNIDLDHAVMMTGYGVDNRGRKFWMIRNSWGGSWGEQGYIRLAREDTKKCGTDSTPQDGSACKGDNTPITVCGMCGINYDGAFPTDAHFVK